MKYVLSPGSGIRTSSLILCLTLTAISHAVVQKNVDMVLVLSTVQQQIQHGQLRQAERRLLDLLQGLGPSSPASSGYHRLAQMLAGIYLASGHYDEAREWAERCQECLTKISDPHGVLKFTRRDVAALLGRIHQAQGAWLLSSDQFRSALALNQERPNPDVLWELDVSASLATVLHSAGNTPEAAGIRDAIEQRATSSQVRRVKSECWSQLASIYRTMNQPIDELRALTHALRYDIEGDGKANSRSLDQLVRVADFCRRTAAALQDISKDGDAVESLKKRPEPYSAAAALTAHAPDRSIAQRDIEVGPANEPDVGELNGLATVYLHWSQTLYRDILHRIESPSDTETSADFESIRAPILQALADVSYRLYISDVRDTGEQQSVTAKAVIADLRKLLKHLSNTALPTDRRIADTKSLLGWVYVTDKLAQAERAGDDVASAQALLEQALQIGTQDLSNQLLANVAIKAGRILMQRQAFDRAEKVLERAKRLAVAADHPISELTANIELANLALSRSDLNRTAEFLDASDRIIRDGQFADKRLLVQIRHQQALFHFVKDGRGGAGDREPARRLWLENLDTQQEHEYPADQQARTLYYLTRLRYRDWSDAVQRWTQKRKEATLSGRTATYEVRQAEYNQRFNTYQKDVQHYNHGPSKSPADYEAFELERASLSAIYPTLKQEYEAASAGAQESQGRFKEDLVQLLSEAECWAGTAVRLMESQDTDLQFHYRALCSHAEVLYAQSVLAENRFSVHLGSEDALDAGRIPDSFRKAIGLTDAASVSIVAAGRTWKIQDSKKKYAVRKGDAELTIHENSGVFELAGKAMCQLEKATMLPSRRGIKTPVEFFSTNPSAFLLATTWHRSAQVQLAQTEDERDEWEHQRDELQRLICLQLKQVTAAEWTDRVKEKTKQTRKSVSDSLARIGRTLGTDTRPRDVRNWLTDIENEAVGREMEAQVAGWDKWETLAEHRRTAWRGSGKTPVVTP